MSNDFSVIILCSLLSVLIIAMFYLQIYILLKIIYFDYTETQSIILKLSSDLYHNLILNYASS